MLPQPIRPSVGDRVAERRVHHADAGGGRGLEVDVVDADAGATHDFQILGDRDHLGRHLGGGTDGEAVICADDVAQFLGLEADLLVDLDAAVAEYLHGGGRQFVRNQNLWHGGHP
jgi:hypothetical protein